MKSNLIIVLLSVAYVTTISQEANAQIAAKQGALVTVDTDDSTFTFRQGAHVLLSYHYGIKRPPKGVDSSYSRSGFIHPVYTPHGQLLTQIQPADHYHHYGIWNPWTHVLFEGDTVDFWNLGSKKGTVRFVKLLSKSVGQRSAEISVVHEHVVKKNDGSEKVALDELQTIHVSVPGKPEGSLDSSSYYILDIRSELRCANQSPVRLLAYRYGGLGWRATAEWNRNNSEVLTSEGKTRNTADSTRARWFLVQGKLGNDYGGILLISNVNNYNYPEPIRVWPDNMNGRGDIFVNYSPTKNMDWLLEPGKIYVLRYRLVIYNGKMGRATADALAKEYGDR